MLRTCVLTIVLALTGVTIALAQLPPQPPPPSSPLGEGSPEERAACAPDVMKFCKQLLPSDPKGSVDVFAIAGCLQTNRAKISAACNGVLAGHGQ
jgi:hypothetical protein